LVIRTPQANLVASQFVCGTGGEYGYPNA